MPSNPPATRFPQDPAPGIQLYVGGREAAESEEWLLEHNIKFVIDCCGRNNDFEYPLAASDDFKTFKLSVGWPQGRE